MKSRLGQAQLPVFGNYDLPALAFKPIEHAQDLRHLEIGIATHAAVVDHHEYSAIAFIVAYCLGDVNEVSSAAIESAHDMEVPALEAIARIRIEHQVDVRMLREAKFFDLPIPVADANEQFFQMAVGRIDPKDAIFDVHAQDAVMNEGANLRSDVDATIAGAKFRRHEFAALRCGGDREQKHTC